MDKAAARIRRATSGRAKMRRLSKYRLSVFRTSRHVYAQVISPTGAQVIVSASTLESEVRKTIGYTGNCDAASFIGKRIAEKALAAGIDSVAFDRSGFKYHGRVKSVAEAAREAGLKF